jgi:hypothetical protein
MKEQADCKDGLYSLQKTQRKRGKQMNIERYKNRFYEKNKIRETLYKTAWLPKPQTKKEIKNENNRNR